MNYIPRSLEIVVGQVTEEYPVVLLTGSRQVGKTTMRGIGWEFWRHWESFSICIPTLTIC